MGDALHGFQKQPKLTLVRLFIHRPGNGFYERGVVCKGQPKLVFKNGLEVLVVSGHLVCTIHGEHDHVFRGVKNRLKLGALCFRLCLVQAHVRDVEKNPTHTFGFAFGVFLNTGSAQHGEHLAVGRHELPLFPLALQRLHPGFATLGQPLHHIVHSALRQFEFRISQKQVERRVHVREVSLVVQCENRVIRALQNVPVPLLAGLQVLLGNLRLGDVPTHSHGAKRAVFLILHKGQCEVNREGFTVLSSPDGLSREG